MAQLRDARTSELVAEGDPLALAHIADELGRRAVVPQPGEDLPDDAELVYDGVGLGFNPDVVLEHHDERADALRTIAGDSDADQQLRDDAAANLAAAEDTVKAARSAASAVSDVVESARDGDRATLEPVVIDATPAPPPH